MMPAFRRILPLVILTAAAAFTLGGCGYRGNLTPELDSYAHNSTQDYNRYARVIDNNTRSIWDDLANLLLINHTSSLNEYPTP